jgi:DNA-directed RNA polymerase subunit M/transcription elongation factor TFIIS
VAGWVCWYSTYRYISFLIGTQRLAERSVCPSCKNYGLFNVIDERVTIGVRCRKCSHEWRLR